MPPRSTTKQFLSEILADPKACTAARRSIVKADSQAVSYFLILVCIVSAIVYVVKLDPIGMVQRTLVSERP